MKPFQSDELVLEDADNKVIAQQQNKQCTLTDMLPNSVLDYIHKKMEDDRDNETENHTKEHWEQIARVTDRFFMILQIIGSVFMLVFIVLRLTTEQSLQTADNNY